MGWGKTWQYCFSFFFFFKAHLIEMLCFTLTAFLFDNASMHSGYKSTLFFWYSKPHKDAVRWIYLASFISGVDAELWHFTCTSKSGFAIQLSDICKGHNLYLFVWFLGCQCLCVEHNFFFFFFFEEQMSEVRVVLGPFCTTNQLAGPCDVFSPQFLFLIS